MADETQAMLTCPYCSSEQPFPVRSRPHEGSDTVIEVYISCTRCPFEHQLRLSTERLEHLRRLEANLSNQATMQKARYGKPTAVNDLAFMRVRELMGQEEAGLDGE
jgi:C4-type Zn-finger protein